MFSSVAIRDFAIFFAIVVLCLAVIPRIAPTTGPRVAICVWVLLVAVVVVASVWNLLEVH
jgi:hypothetical protein